MPRTSGGRRSSGSRARERHRERLAARGAGLRPLALGERVARAGPRAPAARRRRTARRTRGWSPPAAVAVDDHDRLAHAVEDSAQPRALELARLPLGGERGAGLRQLAAPRASRSSLVVLSSSTVAWSSSLSVSSSSLVAWSSSLSVSTSSVAAWTSSFATRSSSLARAQLGVGVGQLLVRLERARGCCATDPLRPARSSWPVLLAAAAPASASSSRRSRTRRTRPTTMISDDLGARRRCPASRLEDRARRRSSRRLQSRPDGRAGRARSPAECAVDRGADRSRARRSAAVGEVQKSLPTAGPWMPSERRAAALMDWMS